MPFVMSEDPWVHLLVNLVHHSPGSRLKRMLETMLSWRLPEDTNNEWLLQVRFMVSLVMQFPQKLNRLLYYSSLVYVPEMVPKFFSGSGS